jgi:hypothetical protein
MAFPPLGTTVSIIKVTKSGRKLMATHPNKTSGKLEGYLNTLRKRYTVGECKRHVVEIVPIEE